MKNIIIFILCGVVCIFTYVIGRRDSQDDFVRERARVNHHKNEAEFFYQKWREEESLHFKTQLELDRLKYVWENKLK